LGQPLDKTIHVTVQVVDEYKALSVQESSADGIGKDMMSQNWLTTNGSTEATTSIRHLQMVRKHALVISLKVAGIMSWFLIKGRVMP